MTGAAAPGAAVQLGKPKDWYGNKAFYINGRSGDARRRRAPRRTIAARLELLGPAPRPALDYSADWTAPIVARH